MWSSLQSESHFNNIKKPCKKMLKLCALNLFPIFILFFSTCFDNLVTSQSNKKKLYKPILMWNKWSQETMSMVRKPSKKMKYWQTSKDLIKKIRNREMELLITPSVMCKVCLTVSNTILGADAVDRQNHRTLSNICLYKCTNIRYRGARLVA